jgi:hypothetical protein
MKLKIKRFPENDHVWECDICWDMERRGYRSEPEYWSGKKLRKIKYRLVKKELLSQSQKKED